jgi:hypothetical protein
VIQLFTGLRPRTISSSYIDMSFIRKISTFHEPNSSRARKQTCQHRPAAPGVYSGCFYVGLRPLESHPRRGASRPRTYSEFAYEGLRPRESTLNCSMRGLRPRNLLLNRSKEGSQAPGIRVELVPEVFPVWGLSQSKEPDPLPHAQIPHRRHMPNLPLSSRAG